jgi:hypothetical protein
MNTLNHKILARRMMKIERQSEAEKLGIQLFWSWSI